jgi:hypothetical protein
MARIRSSKPEWWTSAKWCRLPRDLRATYKGIWEVMCDDEGRFLADPRQVKADVWPLDDDITPKKIASWLPRIGSVNVTLEDKSKTTAIVFYDVEGVRYGFVPGFVKHQKISHKTPSKLPPLPESLRISSGMAPENIPPDREMELEVEGDVEKEKETTDDIRGRVREAFPEGYHDDLNSLLDIALAKPSERESWLRSLHAVLFDGYEFPTHDPEILGQGLREMLGAQGAPTWRKYAGFVRPLTKNDSPPAKSNEHGKIEPAIELAAGQQLEEIQKLKVRTQTSVGIKFHIPVASLEELPPAVQSAIAALGGSLTSGAQRILDAQGTERYGIILGQFTKLYAGAIATERARILSPTTAARES